MQHSSSNPDYRAKDLGNYRDLGRGPTTSYFRRLAAREGHAPEAGFFARLAAFTSDPTNWAAWAGHVMRYILSGKHPFQSYGNGAGIFELEEKMRLSVAGDWGTGTDEAQHVTCQMKKHDPDYTVHLGDVYYVGDKPELEENCLGKSSSHQGVKWQLGTKGSFALNGNHEMYACGTAYFEEFLPRLGRIDPNTGHPSGQKASYFCLRNKHWSIIGLDTGYNSVGVSSALSFLSRFKGVQWFRKTSWFKPSCALHDDILNWLNKAGDSDEGDRGSGLMVISVPGSM